MSFRQQLLPESRRDRKKQFFNLNFMPLPRLKIVNHKPKEIAASDWMHLQKMLDDVPGDWCEGDILNLGSIKTIKFKETATDIFVLAIVTAEKGAQKSLACSCGAGQSNLKKNGMTAVISVLDQPIRGKQTQIYYRAHRYFCRACKKTVQQPCPDRDEHHRLTKRLVGYIERTSLDIRRNFSDIARETGVAERVVRNIFTAHAVKLERERRIATPAWIAVDEVYPKSRRNVRCVITDPLQRTVLDFLSDKSSKTLFRWLLQLPNRHEIKVVSMDMDKGFRLAVSEALPNAKIVIDRFHVHNILSVALKEVLDVVRESLTRKQREEQMRPEYLLLKSRYQLTDKKSAGIKDCQKSEKQIVEQWLHEVPDVARAYTLKEDFSDILQMAKRDAAERRTTIWLEQLAAFLDYFLDKYSRECRRLRKYPFRNVPSTFGFWLSEILNYIDYKNEFSIRVTNAFAEFANGQIKQATVVATVTISMCYAQNLFMGSF
jgi:transposase